MKFALNYILKLEGGFNVSVLKAQELSEQQCSITLVLFSSSLLLSAFLDDAVVLLFKVGRYG